MSASPLQSFVGAFLAALGFAFLLRTPRRCWIVASLLGGLGYTLYTIFLSFGWSDAMSMFTGMLTSALIAQFAARKLRMISTACTTLAVIPAVPGLGLYRAMSLLTQGNTESSVDVGVTAMTEIVMIALALGVSTFITRRLTQMIAARKAKRSA
jgi:uncharacterized membrane protein YjjB (DUF3815 family)